MNAREKAYWLSKVNPYKETYLKDSFKSGARAYWTGIIPEFRGNSRERAAFNKGYVAAEKENKPSEPSKPSKPNPTVARLDRTALKMGVVSYVKRGTATREFTLPSGRIIRFQPGGKGVLRVTALDWKPDEAGSGFDGPGEWIADAECVASIERLERIMLQSATIANE